MRQSHKSICINGIWRSWTGLRIFTIRQPREAREIGIMTFSRAQSALLLPVSPQRPYFPNNSACARMCPFMADSTSFLVAPAFSVSFAFSA